METKWTRPALLAAGALLGGALFWAWAVASAPPLFAGAAYRLWPFALESGTELWRGGFVSLLLWCLLGLELAAATLPFAAEGRALVLCSLGHYASMMATVGVWIALNFGARETPLYLLLLTLLYALVWLGRWVGWYAEAAQIRARLGLAPAPSPLRWRETLPHLGFALLLCLVLPAALSLCDAVDVPVFTALFYPWLFLPVGAFVSACSLGRRQGFCPLYPLACALLSALFAGLAQLWTKMPFGVLPPIAFTTALLGLLLGAILRRLRSGN